MAEKVLHESIITTMELIELHKQYETIIRNEFEFYFKHLNFYITLFTTLIGLTVTGMLAFKGNDSFLLLLLAIGPLLIILTSKVAIKNIECYYRRAMEAIITVINLNAMLGYCKKPELEKGINAPIFFSETGGFLTQSNTPKIIAIIKEAETRTCTSEELLEKLVSNGDIVTFAKNLFTLFVIAAILLIALTVFYFIFL
jgi:hypothetical protein